MQFKQTLVKLFLLLLTIPALSQTTYFPQGARENIITERLEIKLSRDSILNFSKIRPLSRKMIVPRLEDFVVGHNSYTLSGSDTVTTYSHGRGSFLKPRQYQATEGITLSAVDQYNLRRALTNNVEWTDYREPARRPVGKHFYKTPSNLYEVHAKDFFLAVNPVFQYYVGKQNDYDGHLFLNTRGVSLRGRIADKIGFSAYITDNQERDPLYVQRFVRERRAVPGQGFFKSFKEDGYDYFDARGSITFNAAKYIDIQFGYDKHFIGNGERSLYLSDFSAPLLFLKLNTRIWKFNYTNLFMELNSANRLNADQLLPKKYAAMHHLDMAITKWLNVGLFEGVVFGRQNKFEFGYLNPVIFYRSVEQQSGSFDNAVLGLDAKANLKGKYQLYGQFILDEFNLTQLRKGSGWWANKVGFQLGAKYIDAFNIPNLDLIVEANRVRPFTYSHRDSVANYTHYNQPLAHPLGANFGEWIGILRYQPTSRLFLEAKGIYYMQGRDTAGSIVTFGSNIFLPNVPPYRTREFGYELGGGIRTKTALASLLFSYELRPNFFIELNPVYRRQAATTLEGGRNELMLFGGVRWNMHRRDFLF